MILDQLSRKLDSLTTYVVVSAGLALLAIITIVLSWLDILTYSSPFILIATLLTLLGVSFVANLLFTKLYKLPFTQGPTLITGLILFFVLAAPTSSIEWVGIVFAAVVAIASKYVITWRGANIFNPAALGAFVVGVLGIGYGAWWVASPVLFVPVLLLAIVVLAKLRRFELFFAFLIPALALILLQTYQGGGQLGGGLITALTLYPLLFLGSIMLTEPGTMPATRTKRLIYGAIVGLVLGSQIDTNFISTSPHLALLAGNVFALFATRRTSARLELVSKQQLSPTTYEYAFKSDKHISFVAGQYMEFSMDGLQSDSRGNRRTFSIVSHPAEELLRIAVKFYEPGSWFKTKLKSLPVGDQLIGNHVAGDFILPKSTAEPLVFMAGGIGITPFISMLQSIMIDGKKYNITLYYFVSNDSEIVYKDILKKAQQHGVKIEIRDGSNAALTNDDLKKHEGSHFYLSGPPGFVGAYKKQLKSVPTKSVHTDYFSGY